MLANIVYNNWEDFLFHDLCGYFHPLRQKS